MGTHHTILETNLNALYRLNIIHYVECHLVSHENKLLSKYMWEHLELTIIVYMHAK